MYKSTYSYFIAFGLFAGLLIIYLLAFNLGIWQALAFSALPAIALGAMKILQQQYIFYAFFVLNYFIMGIDRYFPLKGGMIMAILALSLPIVLIVRNLFEHLEWQRSKNFLTIAWCIWFFYCVLELFNPRALIEPWSIAIANYALYPLLCAIVVPILFTRYKHFQWLLIIWAILTILAAAKGYWQRNRGFDAAELTWLFYEGGAKTHIIHSGIRFFSFFTDAASYGASMGLSLVVFGISGFYISKRWLKILFWTAAIGGGYGLIISGTRSDLAVPFVGLIVYLILCRNAKAIIITTAFLVGTFIFLNFTTIGNSNSLIRRTRSAFNLQDGSLQVRIGHSKQIYQLMQDKPFGVGLGLAGNKANRFRAESQYDPLTYMPTDSWYIMAYAETGVVGLTLYLTLLIMILLRGSFIISFNILHRELQGQLYAIIAAIAGILFTCIGNEVLNYPNGIIVYTLMAFLFIAPYYDKDLKQNEPNT